MVVVLNRLLVIGTHFQAEEPSNGDIQGSIPWQHSGGSMDYIEAKPTRYRGVQFKSRLEARWAIFLDNLYLITEWVYEPAKFKMQGTNWEYTPDFRISLAVFQLYLEIKPTECSPEYLHVLTQFARGLKGQHLWLCQGDFWGTPIIIKNLSIETSQRTLLEALPRCQDAIQAAKNYRFDLLESKPAIRDGSMGHLQQNISEQISFQRRKSREQRKKKDG